LLPSEAEQALLFDLARRGDIKKILAEADRLEHSDPRYAAFIQKVRALAESFKVKQLCQFLEAACAQPASDITTSKSQTTSS
jgi:hypothetical protein